MKATFQCVILLLALLLLAEQRRPALAADPADSAVRWVETAALTADEAHQAAAADEQFVYAITNDRVARYDRQTGRRLAVSSGKAKHLNSGFLWQGRLLCAHSNFPRKPEQSEIMALDLDTLELSVFKDFGNFGGSLTWAVHHQEHWWCNFALYGKDNAGTFLVKFDANWKELGRWTYPAEVIRKLGTYSISGGVWHDDALLVTGHDAPLLFRLRLPTAGNTLELEREEPAPFHGQGIAIDSQTGGLVGIERAKRRVVFAEIDSANEARD